MNTILTALLNGMLIGVPLVFAVWIALYLIPRNSLNAATRYAIWWAALLAVAVIPMYYFSGKTVAPSAPRPALLAIAIPASGTLPPKPVPESGPAEKVSHPAPASSPAASPSPRHAVHTFPFAIPAGAWPARIVILWLACALLMLTRLVVSAVAMERRKMRAWEPPPDLAARAATQMADRGSNRRVRVALSREITVPLVSGPWRPTILLPARYLDELSEQDLEQIVIHETAHLLRSDDYALLVQRTVQAILFMNPVAHWISRRIDLEREIACDDFVIAATGRAQSFAACLARVVELSGGVRATPIATAAVQNSSDLARRVEMLLDQTKHFGTRLSKPRLVLAATCLTALSWGAVQTPGIVSLTPPTRSPHVQHTAQIAQAEVPAPPQPPAPPPPPPPPATVIVPVDVRDPQGRFVTGLDQTVFRISEDSVPQTITQLAENDGRADLFVLVGAEVNPEPVLQPLLDERVQVNQTVKDVQVHGFGQLPPDTSPLHAVQIIQRRLRHISVRQAALIVTDSASAAERYTPDDLKNVPGDIDMPVYVLDLSQATTAQQPANGDLTAAAFLKELASRTGGQYIAVQKQQDIPDLLAKIVITTQNMYVLTYTPLRVARTSAYRILRIGIDAPRGLPPLTVHYRSSYNPPSQ